MSLHHQTVVTCWRCTARSEFSTDWRTSKLVETVLKACVCTEAKPELTTFETQGTCADCGGEVIGWAARCPACKANREAALQKVYTERFEAKKSPNALTNDCQKCGKPCRRKLCLNCSNQKHAIRNARKRNAA